MGKVLGIPEKYLILNDRRDFVKMKNLTSESAPGGGLRPGLRSPMQPDGCGTLEGIIADSGNIFEDRRALRRKWRAPFRADTIR